MKDPRPVHLTTTEEVRAQGWIAEARDDDGHLMSCRSWASQLSANQNLQGLGEFISEYEEDATVTVFADVVAAKLTANPTNI